MKIYVKAAVSIENLKAQFAQDMDQPLFEQLISLDPTANLEQNKGGKYCPWIFRQYKKGNLQKSDFDNLADALHMFSTQYRKYPKPDLGQYKTVEEFLQDTHAVGNRELTDKEKAKLLKKQAHNAGDDDKKFICEDGEWEVWQPLTYQGSISLARTGGKKASWCTAYEGNDNYWQSYTRRGPLYIFINTADPGEKYQLHMQSDSWYDINDRNLGMNRFYSFCNEHPNIAEAFEVKTIDGMQMCAGNIVGFDPDIKDLIIPENITTCSYEIPSGVQRIAFINPNFILDGVSLRGHTELTKVKLPTNCKEIPSMMFEGCTALTSIKIPESVTIYGNSAFEGCSALTSIEHSSKLEKIGDRCFKGCKNLTNLGNGLPETVNHIGANAFENVPISSLSIPAELKKIDKSTFARSDISEYILNNVQVIGANAFRESKVEYIDLKNVVQIGSNAFRGCNYLKDPVLSINPDGVAISPYAFAESDFESTVTIYPTTKLGICVFDSCPNVTVEWQKEDEPYEFDNIKLLICDEKKCPQLFEANKGYVTIQSAIDGKIYEAED